MCYRYHHIPTVGVGLNYKDDLLPAVWLSDLSYARYRGPSGLVTFKRRSTQAAGPLPFS
jgi:hypothetical protein